MSALTPIEILARTREVYATCRTYRDEGVVVTRFVHLDAGGRAHSDRKPFCTDFVRPDRFRFEWAEADVGPEHEWARMLVLWNELGIRESWSIRPGIRTHTTIHAPIGAATGVSDGSAYTVPSLLFAGGGGRDPLDAEGAVLSGQRVCGERECFVLQYPSDGERLWIGCDDFLVHRIDERRSFGRAEILDAVRRAEAADPPAPTEESRRLRARALADAEKRESSFRTETATTYAPRVNVVIPPARFAEPAAWPRADAPVADPPAPPLVFLSSRGSPPSAGELLARVRRVYASCARLRDRGTRTTVHVPRRGLGTKQETFALHFVRPDRFRLETAEVAVGPQEEWDGHRCLWNAERITQRSRHVPGFRKDYATGAELLAGLWLSSVVPGLLAPGSEGEPALADAVWLGLAEHEGYACDLVRGTCWNDTVRTLWIDREHGCLRRCDDVHEFDEVWRARMLAQAEERLRQPLDPKEREAKEFAIAMFSRRAEPYRTETTMRFAPEFDIELAPELFATPADWE